MLDRLPPEILLEILSWTRHHPSQTPYLRASDVNQALCRCAVVSKKVKSAAETLIWRKIEIRSNEGWKGILAGAKDRTRARHARELIVSSPNADVSVVIRAFPTLRTVSVTAGWTARMLTQDEAAGIGALPVLSTLVLTNVELSSQSLVALSTLSSLTTLGLTRQCTIKVEDAASLLSAEKTPNLRVLELSPLCQPGANVYFLPLSAALLSRIERLRLSSSDYGSPTRAIAVPAFFNKILLVLDHPRHEQNAVMSRLSPVHVSLRSFTISEATDLWAEQTEQAAISILQQPLSLLHASTTLKSIGIGASIRDGAATHPPLLAATYAALLTAAAEHNVEIWWFRKDAFEEFGRYLRSKEGEASGGEGS